MILFLAFIYYTLITLLSAQFLTAFSVLTFVGVFYILPLIVTTFILKLVRNKKEKLLTAYTLLLPTMAVVSYLTFGVMVTGGTQWKNFVLENSMKTSEFAVNISQNPIELSQIIFVILLYFGVAAISYYISNRKVEKVQYA